MALSMPIKQALEEWLAEQRWGNVVHLEPVSGGCICDNYAVLTQSGQKLFIKTQPPTVSEQLFPREAQGLEALRDCGALRVPEVYHIDSRFLALEYIAPGDPAPSFWPHLAEGLATIHRIPRKRFGFTADNFCGSTPQPNPQYEDGYRFFGEQRLRYQGEIARRANRITAGDMDQLEKVITRLVEWIPEQKPALIHGDLWSGNIYCASSGEPVLIDPACYWGWREADIAMTRLFGALPRTFYNSYQQCYPMPDGWEQRLDLYNLYHLLNHLNLFGSAYLGQVKSSLARFQ